jgi:hypothetical protein
MHDECMVGIGGTAARWYPGDRDVRHDAKTSSHVVERLKMDRVRNFTSLVRNDRRHYATTGRRRYSFAMLLAKVRPMDE